MPYLITEGRQAQFGVTSPAQPLHYSNHPSATPVAVRETADERNERESEEYLKTLQEQKKGVGPEVNVTASQHASDLDIYGDLESNFGSWTKAAAQDWVRKHPKLTEGMTEKEGLRAFRDNAIRNRFKHDPNLSKIMALSPEDRDWLYDKRSGYRSPEERSLAAKNSSNVTIGGHQVSEKEWDSIYQQDNEKAFNTAYKNTLAKQEIQSAPLADKYFKAMLEDSTPEQQADYVKQFDQLAENSPYWKVYGGTRKLHMTPYRKMKELAKYMAHAEFSPQLAFDGMSKDFQDMVYENTPWTEQYGNAIQGAFVDALSSMASTIVAGQAFLGAAAGAVNGKGVQRGFYDALNSDFAKWTDRAFKYNTFDYGEQLAAERNGGISPYQVRQSFDQEHGETFGSLFNESTFPQLIEQAGPTIAAMATSYLTGGASQVTGGMGRAAFSGIKRLGAGFKTLKTLTKAGRVGRALDTVNSILAPAVQAGVMDATEAMDNAKLEMAPIVDDRWDGASKLFDLDEDSQEYQQIYNKILEEYTQRSLAATGVAEEAKKEAQDWINKHQQFIKDPETGRMTAKYNIQDIYNGILADKVNSEKARIKQNLDADLNAAKESLGTTALQQFIMGTAVNSEGFLHWKRGQLNRGVRARLAQRKKQFLNNFEITAEGKVRVKPKAKLPLLIDALQEPLGEGFQEMTESITGGFATGYGVNDFSNYMKNKYDPDSMSEQAGWISNLWAGLNGGNEALHDTERIRDFTFGFLGSFTGAFNPYTFFSGMGNRLAKKVPVRNADGTIQMKDGKPKIKLKASRSGWDWADYLMIDVLRNPVYEAARNRHTRQKELQAEQERWQKIVDNNKDAFFTNSAIAAWGKKAEQAAEKGDKFGYHTSQLGKDIQSIQWLDDIADTELRKSIQDRMENLANMSTTIGENGPTEEQAALLDEVRNGVDSQALYSGKSDQEVLEGVKENAKKLLDTQKQLAEAKTNLMKQFDSSGIDVNKETINAMAYQKVAMDNWKQWGNDATQTLGGTYRINESAEVHDREASAFFNKKKDAESKQAQAKKKLDEKEADVKKKLYDLSGKATLTKEDKKEQKSLRKQLDDIAESRKKLEKRNRRPLTIKEKAEQIDLNNPILGEDGKMRLTKEAINNMSPTEKLMLVLAAANDDQGKNRSAGAKVVDEWYSDFLKAGHTKEEFWDNLAIAAQAERQYKDAQAGYAQALNSPREFEAWAQKIQQDSIRNAQEKVAIQKRKEQTEKAKKAKTQDEMFDAVKSWENEDINELLDSDDFNDEQKSWLKDLQSANNLVYDVVSALSSDKTLKPAEQAQLFSIIAEATSEAKTRQEGLQQMKDVIANSNLTTEQRQFMTNLLGRISSKGKTRTATSKTATQSKRTQEGREVREEKEEKGVKEEGEEDKKTYKDPNKESHDVEGKTEDFDDSGVTLPKTDTVEKTINGIITSQAKINELERAAKGDTRAQAQKKNHEKTLEKYRSTLRRAGLTEADIDALVDYYVNKKTGMPTTISDALKEKVRKADAKLKDLQEGKELKEGGIGTAKKNIRRFFALRGKGKRSAKETKEYKKLQDWIKKTFKTNNNATVTKIAKILQVMFEHNLPLERVKYFMSESGEKVNISDGLREMVANGLNIINGVVDIDTKESFNPEGTVDFDEGKQFNPEDDTVDLDDKGYNPEDGENVPTQEELIKQLPGWSQGPEVRVDDEKEDNSAPVRISPQFIGNPLSPWDTSALRKGKLRGTENAVTREFLEWLDAHNIHLQDVIDEELGKIKGISNYRVRFISVNPNHAGAKVFGEHKIKLLAIEASSAIKQNHKDKNGSFIKVNGKEYLVIGTFGYSAQAGMENASQVKKDWEDTYDWLNDKSQQYFNGHPDEEFFVDDAYTKVTNIQFGRLIKGVTEDDNADDLVSIGELLHDSSRNPNSSTKYKSLAWGYTTSNGMHTYGTGTTEVAEIVSEKAGAGAAYVLIPGADGRLYPVYIQPAWYGHGDVGKRYIDKDSVLAKTIDDLVEKLASEDAAVRKEVIKELYKYLVFTDDYNVIVGTQKNNTMVLKSRGNETQFFDMSNADDRRAFAEAFKQAGFRINVTPAVMQNDSMLEMYDAAGALMTDVKYLGRRGGSFTIAAVNREDGKPIVKETPTFEGTTEGKTAEGYTQVIIESSKYYRDENGRYWDADSKKEITDKKLQDKIDQFLLWEQDKGWQKANPDSEDSKAWYLLMEDKDSGKTRVLWKDRGNIYFLDDDKAADFLKKRANSLKKRRAAVENKVAKYQEEHKDDSREDLLKEEDKLQDIIASSDETMESAPENGVKYNNAYDAKQAAQRELAWVRERLAEENKEASALILSTDKQAPQGGQPDAGAEKAATLANGGTSTNNATVTSSKHNANVQKNLESSKENKKYDEQGNPIQNDGKLIKEKVLSINDISDNDFTSPTRSIELPELPSAVDKAIGANGRAVVIKKNIFEKNAETHKDLTPQESRSILQNTLYNPAIIGQAQPITRPHYWVVIEDTDGKSITVLEVNSNKENIEVVSWHKIDKRGLEKIKRQAEREDGQLLIQTSDEAAAALSTLTPTKPSQGKDTKKIDNTETNNEKKILTDEKSEKGAVKPPKNLDGSENFSTFEAQFRKNENQRKFRNALKGTKLMDDLRKAGIRSNDAKGIAQFLKDKGAPLSDAALSDFDSWLDNVKNCYSN